MIKEIHYQAIDNRNKIHIQDKYIESILQIMLRKIQEYYRIEKIESNNTDRSTNTECDYKNFTLRIVFSVITAPLNTLSH